MLDIVAKLAENNIPGEVNELHYNKGGCTLADHSDNNRMFQHNGNTGSV
jgi:hypothetical protein